ncbi:MAG: metal ABC transporter substrate-binding protein [Raoultibacter sp.]|jgi:zinc transport system substrate-binding protein
MKKLIACIVALSLAVFPFVACSNSQAQSNEDTINVVCTYFPQYDWAKEIIGETDTSVELNLLLDNGVDLHSFQPSAEDIAAISNCDLFIYVGGESDLWVEDVLKTSANEDMIVINLMEALGDSVKIEEIKEGMQSEEESDHSDAHEHEDSEYDEHIWLSLRNAEKLSQQIADALSELDSENSSSYQANCQAYAEQLATLDGEYQDLVNQSAYNTLLFGDRFPFRYLVDDYNLDYYAAFAGCSSETAASFETIVTLARILDEQNLKTVMVTENSDEAIAKAIIQNSQNKNQQIRALNSMQSVTASELASGTSYISLAESNLEVLKEALN